ncbi:hypothetical protein [Legionella worsleiensis]|nr:hypothetical protein [Legionella worsleiensis]
MQNGSPKHFLGRAVGDKITEFCSLINQVVALMQRKRNQGITFQSSTELA